MAAEHNIPLTVTSPSLPPIDEFEAILRDIWSRRWITNNGEYHNRLEKALTEYLKIRYISLYTNGTIPIVSALQALDISGEVITTPYSFVASAHSIRWNKCTPVFVDIDPKDGNIDPDRIEEAITPRTTAILPVHVYGHPCDTVRIREIADRHGLKVIYDAAHAFGVEVNGKSILEEGDISTVSFHATKVFNTAEGGAMVVHDEAMKRRVDEMKNFGIHDDVTIADLGINAKMDEIRAAYGLLNLKYVDEEIAARRKNALLYRDVLRDIPGIRFFEDIPGVRSNYSYFPIFINKAEYGKTRDELFVRLKENGILCRRYFYPLISKLEAYHSLPSAADENLPCAVKMSEEVLCLPMHGLLSEESVGRVTDCIDRYR